MAARESRKQFALPDGSVAKVGDWVYVRARVAETESPHQEEMSVMFRTHNEDYLGLVLIEHVEQAEPPEDWPRCGAMYEVRMEPTQVAAYLRCERSNGHSGRHEASMRAWEDGEAAGWMGEG